jgi:hypothetical protein
LRISDYIFEICLVIGIEVAGMRNKWCLCYFRCLANPPGY